ncbi:MAG: hypothetical protein OEY59_04495 [Deltaproteobacteria bacterium]|nr:hypothetical protein [Deltaproteobacteria bacterium]
MEIYQLIYTKFASREDSPLGKTGQHTAFYSQQFLSADDIQKIEKWMFFPTKKAWSKKLVVFYQEINQKLAMIVLHSQFMEKARDHAGRTGIYLCQGFVIPDDVLSRLSNISKLIEWLVGDNHLYSDRESLLISDEIDRQSGDIKPLIISMELIESFNEPTITLDDFSKKFLITLVNTCSKQEFIPLFLKASAEEIKTDMTRVLPFLPRELKLNAGWDPDYRKESIADFPGRIFGVGSSNPLAKKAHVIQLGERDISQFNDIIDLRDSFTSWLYQAEDAFESLLMIEEAFELSKLIENDRPVMERDFTDILPSFLKINQQSIQEAVIRNFQNKWKLGAEISRKLTETYETFEQLKLLIHQLPIESFSVKLEKLLFESFPNENIPQEIIDKSAGRLALLKQVKNGEEIKLNQLQGLEHRQRDELISCLLENYWSESSWIIDLLQRYPTALEFYLSRANFNVTQIIELYRNLEFDDISLANLPITRLIFKPEETRGLFLKYEGLLRQKMIEALIHLHGYRLKDAEKFGFALGEWSDVEKNSVVKPSKGLLKNLFR